MIAKPALAYQGHALLLNEPVQCRIQTKKAGSIGPRPSLRTTSYFFCGLPHKSLHYQVPKVIRVIVTSVFLAYLLKLSMAVMAWRNDNIGLRVHHLIKLELAIRMLLIFEPRLVRPSAPAAAEVIRHVRPHINKVFFTRACLNDKTKILRSTISEAFANKVAGILTGKLLPIGVP